MKPITCTTESVRGILDERKNQTRRVITNWPPKIKVLRTIRGIRTEYGGKGLIGKPGIYQSYSNKHGALSINIDGSWLGVKPKEFEWISPYGVPGDKLWVKETWNAKSIDRTWWGDMAGTCSEKMAFNWNLWYKAESEACEKWRSSRFMPKAFSRITLEIKDIRVERVQDITEKDAGAEGVNELDACDHKRQSCQDIGCYGTGYKGAFSYLWDSINLKRGYGWDTNPWVFVIEFRHLKQ